MKTHCFFLILIFKVERGTIHYVLFSIRLKDFSDWMFGHMKANTIKGGNIDWNHPLFDEVCFDDDTQTHYESILNERRKKSRK